MDSRRCSVEGCNGEGLHRLSYLDARILEKHGLKLNPIDAQPPRRPGYVYLCEEHYKMWRRLSKTERLARDLARKGA